MPVTGTIIPNILCNFLHHQIFLLFSCISNRWMILLLIPIETQVRQVIWWKWILLPLCIISLLLIVYFCSYVILHTFLPHKAFNVRWTMLLITPYEIVLNRVPPFHKIASLSIIVWIRQFSIERIIVFRLVFLISLVVALCGACLIPDKGSWEFLWIFIEHMRKNWRVFCNSGIEIGPLIVLHRLKIILGLLMKYRDRGWIVFLSNSGLARLHIVIEIHV